MMATHGVLYATLPSGGSITQLTYGTHLCLITKTNGELITSFQVPNTSNLKLAIK